MSKGKISLIAKVPKTDGFLDILKKNRALSVDREDPVAQECACRYPQRHSKDIKSSSFWSSGKTTFHPIRRKA